MWPFRRPRRRVPLHWQPQPPTAIITDDGRRHLVQVPYLLPKDPPEHDRLNFQHYFLSSVLGGLYAAPVPRDLTDILDVGCGTGLWVREMAREFPAARVIGVDLEPPANTTQATLPNCYFLAGNVLERLPYPNASFDFVHQRLLIAAIPARKWQSVVNELVRVTKRGGWVELFEVSTTYPQAGPQQRRFLQWGQTAAQAVGIDYRCALHLHELLTNAGLHEVRGRFLQVPLGSWGGRAGSLLARNTIEVYKSLLPLLRQQAGVTNAEFEDVLARLPQEWNAYNTCCEFPFAYGQA